MKISENVKNIRINWALGDKERDEGLTTPDDIKRFDDISYGPYGTENLLDIYVMKNVTKPGPTIVNIHGGGWVYGSKEVYQFYCMSLAQRGFTVVNINYRLAPETLFPGAVEDINAAITFLEKEGYKYYVDKDRLVLVGDSAGGQLVSHYATILTNPEFAAKFDFKTPDVTVKAVGLNCGAYFTRDMATNRDDDVFLEYLGCVEKEVPEELIDRVDTIKYMTSDFPPAFVMSTECDFLLHMAAPMAEHLKSLSVPYELKIYGAKDRPEIGHVFHVNCRLEEAKICNDEEAEFFSKYV